MLGHLHSFLEHSHNYTNIGVELAIWCLQKWAKDQIFQNREGSVLLSV